MNIGYCYDSGRWLLYGMGESYEGAFELTLSAEAGKTIYYMLDGSVPILESPKYEKPILIRDITKMQMCMR